MKRQYISLEEVVSEENLLIAEQMAGSGRKSKRPQVIAFRRNLADKIRSLRERVLSGEYVPDKGNTFTIVSQGKLRRINNVNYEARIIDQVIVNAIEPKVTRRYIHRTYGCVNGRGQITASKRLRGDMRHCKVFVEADVRRYYPSICRKILMSFLRHIFKGEAFLSLVERVLNAYENTAIANAANEGISIGSLKSQVFGNLYLTAFDYFVHQTLKIRHYVRFVDNILAGFANKSQARRYIRKAVEYMRVKLHLVLAKIRIIPIGKQIIDFCMYQCRVDRRGKVYTFLRRRIYLRMLRKFRYLTKRYPLMRFADNRERDAYILRERCSVCSYLGALKFCNSVQTIKILKNEFSKLFERVERLSSTARRRQASSLATPAPCL